MNPADQMILGDQWRKIGLMVSGLQFGWE